MSKLKDCPCCGGRAMVKAVQYPFLFAINCKECNLTTDITSLDRAKALWNRRVHEEKWESILKGEKNDRYGQNETQ